MAVGDEGIGPWPLRRGRRVMAVEAKPSSRGLGDEAIDLFSCSRGRRSGWDVAVEANSSPWERGHQAGEAVVTWPLRFSYGRGKRGR